MTLALCPPHVEFKPFLPWRSSFCHTPTGDLISKYSVYNPLPVIDLRRYSNILMSISDSLSCPRIPPPSSQILLCITELISCIFGLLITLK